jgi:hypothetical protein
MSKTHFDAGIRYFLQTLVPVKPALIEACKRKYPQLNGRGVNFVIIPLEALGDTWRWGFVVDPGRFHMSKGRIREAIEGLDDEHVKTIEQQIDLYNPDTEVLFCFSCSGPHGAWLSIEII